MFGFGHQRDDVPVDEAYRLAAGDHRIVDVREHHEFTAGHAPGALHIPLGELTRRARELDPSVSWLAVCRSGARSAQATSFLRSHGLHVRNVTGGMGAWLRARLPVHDAAGRPGVVV